MKDEAAEGGQGGVETGDPALCQAQPWAALIRVRSLELHESRGWAREPYKIFGEDPVELTTKFMHRRF